MSNLFLLLEVLLFFSGAYVINMRAVPPRLLRLLFGPGEYQLDGKEARLFGLVLALPLLIMLVVPFIALTLWGEAAQPALGVVEALLLMGAIATCARLARRARL